MTKPRAVSIHPSRMRLSEYERQDWVCNAESGHTVEDCLTPMYWAHMAPQMNYGDHIEVRAEDGQWIAEFFVLQVDRNWAKVLLMKKFDLSTIPAVPPVESQHKVEWKGPQIRFCAIRSADMAIVKEGFLTKAEALQWVKEHEKLVATT